LVPLSSAVLLVAGGALLAAVGGLPLVCANATFDRTNPALSAASNRQLLAIVDLQFFLKSKIKEQSWFPALAIKSSGFRANCARLSMGETSAGISRPVRRRPLGFRVNRKIATIRASPGLIREFSISSNRED
jgi:hypothetical protein